MATASASTMDTTGNNTVMSMVIDHPSSKRILSMNESSDSECSDTNDKSTKSRTSHKKKKLYKNKNQPSNSNHSKTVSSPDVNTSSQLSKSAAIDDAIESVLSQSRSESMVIGDSDSIKQINELKEIINKQNIIINNVVTRLNFLLSMFSIDEVSMPSLSTSAHNCLEDSSNGGAISVNNCPIPSSQHVTGDGIELSSDAVANTTTKQLYSSVAGRSIQPKQTEQQFTKLRQSLVAAVYIDQRDKDNRASSFIISGLPTSAVQSDTSIVKELCSNEFHVQIDVVNTKRLGKTLSSASSSSVKVQPLLVNVKNADHAKQIVSSARQLRKSAVPLVRDNVFINPNLTKAEATAAYELRCRHRETAARRSTTGDRSLGHAAINQPPAAMPYMLPSNNTVSAAVLNASVPPFVPNVSTSSNS